MDTARTRAWRRARARHYGCNHAAPMQAVKPVKNWKLLYMRSEKLNRARQLGFIYPILSTAKLLDQG
ncbi:MAG: hypothetical protein GAK31_01309 [Stenotrophomonas maltophilia]|uniref:Uncharacterized protein n=1 Tax=Stenotrophomonas maltophilia TaxID=40324 RepID=A0A7V8FHB4_STEMA|nr:MAG: hypothetical protein GAK31_01309 [Stenotrophomonas maltophilia]